MPFTLDLEPGYGLECADVRDFRRHKVTGA